MNIERAFNGCNCSRCGAAGWHDAVSYYKLEPNGTASANIRCDNCNNAFDHVWGKKERPKEVVRALDKYYKRPLANNPLPTKSTNKLSPIHWAGILMVIILIFIFY